MAEVTLCTLSTMATIRVSEDIYKELNRVAGRLRQESGHPVSMDDVLEHLLKTRGLKLTDIAGSGTITTEQWNRTQKVLRTADQVNRKKLRTLLQ